MSKELKDIAVSTRADGQAEAAERAPKAIKAIQPNGLLWIAYAKGTSKVKTDVNRDRLWQALEPTGWHSVRMIALDAVWPAMQLKPATTKRL